MLQGLESRGGEEDHHSRRLSWILYKFWDLQLLGSRGVAVVEEIVNVRVLSSEDTVGPTRSRVGDPLFLGQTLRQVPV